MQRLCFGFLIIVKPRATLLSREPHQGQKLRPVVSSAKGPIFVCRSVAEILLNSGALHIILTSKVEATSASLAFEDILENFWVRVP
jgi:hypothetical protein